MSQSWKKVGSSGKRLLKRLLQIQLPTYANKKNLNLPLLIFELSIAFGEPHPFFQQPMKYAKKPLSSREYIASVIGCSRETYTLYENRNMHPCMMKKKTPISRNGKAKCRFLYCIRYRTYGWVHLSKYHITGASSRELIKKCFLRGPQQPTAEGRGVPRSCQGGILSRQR